MSTLLNLSQPPTVALAGYDEMAIGALKAAAGKGINGPDEISVMGFDSILAGIFTVPSLSIIRQPIPDIAQSAVRLLLQMIEGEISPKDAGDILIEPPLVIRGSCASPK